MSYNAKGFLFKEVTQDRIDQLMDRLLGEMRRREDIGVYPIKLKFDNGTVHLRLSEVVYFVSNDKDICVATVNGMFEFRKQLSVVENELCEKGFLRINRSFLVNTSHIFKDFGDYLVISTGEHLTISKNYRDDVHKALKGVKC